MVGRECGKDVLQQIQNSYYALKHKEKHYLLEVGVAPDGPGASYVEEAGDGDDDEDLVSLHTCHPDQTDQSRIPSKITYEIKQIFIVMICHNTCNI